MDKHDDLLLELFSRVKTLEKKVELLELSMSKQNEETNTSKKDDTTNQKITRSTARKYVMDKLIEMNQNITVQKAGQALGSGIIITNLNTKKRLTSKFYYSKSHLDHISSWHTVSSNDISNNEYDLHIFTVSYKQMFYSFFFTKDELINFVKNKTADNANLYHFYFQEQNGNYVEVRDEEKDVSKYLNRWNLVSELTK